MTENLRVTKAERRHLRTLAGEAWDVELRLALTDLMEDFGVWADNGMSSFDLSDKIHEFHNGISRELYGRYTQLRPEISVSRAIAIGLVEESAVGEVLLKKLSDSVESFRKDYDE